MEQRNEIAEQLSRINEQLAIKNRRSKRFWTIVGAVMGLWLLIHMVAAVQISPSTKTTELTISEAVEILEDENGNTLIIQKIED